MAEDLKDSLALQIPPLSLAYVGDSIYDFFVRDRLIREFSGSLNKINSKKKALVCAEAEIIAVLRDLRRCSGIYIIKIRKKD